jgi:hypothetical protein
MWLNLQGNLAMALGWVSGNFAGLESSLDFFLWLLLFGNTEREQRRGRMVTAQLPFQRKVWLFKALAIERLDAKYHPEVEALVKRCGKMEQERNRVTHSLWIGGEGGTARRYKDTARGTLVHQSEKLLVEDVQNIASLIDEVTEDLERLYMTVTNGARNLSLENA